MSTVIASIVLAARLALSMASAPVTAPVEPIAVASPRPTKVSLTVYVAFERSGTMV